MSRNFFICKETRIENAEQDERGPKQIESGRMAFSSIFQKGMEIISNIEVETQSQEASRRLELEKRMKELAKKKDEEKLESDKAGEEIYGSWNSIKSLSVPQDILSVRIFVFSYN